MGIWLGPAQLGPILSLGGSCIGAFAGVRPDFPRFGVGLAQHVLGSDKEGGAAVRAEEEEHRMGEGVQWEVSPVLGQGSWLTPFEGQSGARVSSAEGPVVGGVAV